MRHYTPAEYDAVMESVRNGVGLRETGRRLNIPWDIVKSWKNGVKPRSIVGYQQEYHIPESSKALTPAKAYILGVLCGDGWMKEGGYLLSLNVMDREFIDRFAEKVLCQYGKSCRVYEDKRPSFRCDVSSNQIHADLLGYFGGINPKCYEWRVPKDVLNGADPIKVEFLKGFFDSEGSVNSNGRGQVIIGVNNKEGLLEVQKLLTDLGIESRFGECWHKQRNKMRYFLTLTVRGNNGRKAFYDKIGFTITRKQAILEAAVNR